MWLIELNDQKKGLLEVEHQTEIYIQANIHLIYSILYNMHII